MVRMKTLTNDKERVKKMSMRKEKERKGLQTDGDGFLSAFARVAFTFRQAPFQFFRQAFVTVFTHWLQVHLHKSVPAGPPSGTMRDERGETSEKEGEIGWKIGFEVEERKRNGMWERFERELKGTEVENTRVSRTEKLVMIQRTSQHPGDPI